MKPRTIDILKGSKARDSILTPKEDRIKDVLENMTDEKMDQIIKDNQDALDELKDK